MRHPLPALILSGLALPAAAQLPELTICEAAPGDDMHVLRDLNLDGDYNDMPNEAALYWSDGSTSGTFTGVRQCRIRPEGAQRVTYFTVSTGLAQRVMRGIDANANGVLEVAETNVWLSCVGMNFTQGATTYTGDLEPEGLAPTADGAVWFSADFNFGSGTRPPRAIYRTRDLNMDGDAQDAGELTLIVDNGHIVPTAGGPQPITGTDFVRLCAIGNSVVGYDESDEAAFRFEDLNGDGDVLDAGEALIMLNATGLNPALDQNPDFTAGVLRSLTAPTGFGRLNYVQGALENVSGNDVEAWYFGCDSSSTGSFSTNTLGQFIYGLIFRGVDGNGDGDVNDAGEVKMYYDGANLGGVANGGIDKLVGLYCRGGVTYAATLVGGNFGIHRLQDLNADGDALDAGEQTVLVWDGPTWGLNPPFGPTATPFIVDIGGEVEPLAGSMVNFPEFCDGDGGNQMGCTPCPCGNDASVGTVGGCLNSDARSARLVPSGVPSVAADSLRFTMSGGTSLSFGVLTSGAQRAPNNMANPCFGLDSGLQSFTLDGLRCVVVSVLRHGSRSISAGGDIGTGIAGPGNAGWGPPSGPAGGLLVTSGFTAGQTRHFQVIYRENPALGCLTAQNTSQGVTVAVQP